MCNNNPAFRHNTTNCGLETRSGWSFFVHRNQQNGIFSKWFVTKKCISVFQTLLEVHRLRCTSWMGRIMSCLCFRPNAISILATLLLSSDRVIRICTIILSTGCLNLKQVRLAMWQGNQIHGVTVWTQMLLEQPVTTTTLRHDWRLLEHMQSICTPSLTHSALPPVNKFPIRHE